MKRKKEQILDLSDEEEEEETEEEKDECNNKRSNSKSIQIKKKYKIMLDVLQDL